MPGADDEPDLAAQFAQELSEQKLGSGADDPAVDPATGRAGKRSYHKEDDEEDNSQYFEEDDQHDNTSDEEDEDYALPKSRKKKPPVKPKAPTSSDSPKLKRKENPVQAASPSSPKRAKPSATETISNEEIKRHQEAAAAAEGEEANDDGDADEAVVEEEDGASASGEGDEKNSEEKGASEGVRRSTRKKKPPEKERNENSGIGAEAEEAGEGSGKKKAEKITYELHVDDRWVHDGLDDVEVSRMDPEGDIARVRQQFQDEAKQLETDPNYGRINDRNEFCYMCDVNHTVDPNTGKNVHLDELNNRLKLFHTTSLYFACRRAQEYYVEHILRHKKKTMTIRMWSQHILMHNPSAKTVGKSQYESLQRMGDHMLKTMYPEKENTPLKHAHVRAYMALLEAVRKAKHYYDNASA